MVLGGSIVGRHAAELISVIALAVTANLKVSDIDPARVVIGFGDQRVYPAKLDDDDLAKLAAYMAGDEVLIHVTLGTGRDAATVWGCDLTAGYVRINADYTT